VFRADQRQKGCTKCRHIQEPRLISVGGKVYKKERGAGGLKNRGYTVEILLSDERNHDSTGSLSHPKVVRNATDTGPSNSPAKRRCNTPADGEVCQLRAHTHAGFGAAAVVPRRFIFEKVHEMKLSPIDTKPLRQHYDVVIIGGASMGSAVAWYLANNKDFTGTILVVERDPTYQWTSTAASNNCMRQQFASEINVHIAQYAAEYVKDFRKNLGGDPAVPDLPIQNFGYLYLANNEEFAGILRRDQASQAACGAGTRIVTPAEIAAAYPFYNLDDIVAGSLNLIDEGYFDAPSMVNWWRNKAREFGAEYITNEVTSINRSASRIETIRLRSGELVGAGTVVNASGPRASVTARMAGLDVPIEPRRRYTYIFSAEQPLDRDLPLTIDPTGVHFRTEGRNYLVGCPPLNGDPGVGYDEFGYEDGIWEKKLHPILANRIPQFKDVKIVDSWVGHYEFNTFDQNAIVGPHSQVKNFIFVNGFSGHGSQQAPAMGRGVSELITYGEYRKLDLTPFSYDRLERGERLVERAVI
jgi:glycine/D-amino acid oxidase-like deaminating enzyme